MALIFVRHLEIWKGTTQRENITEMGWNESCDQTFIAVDLVSFAWVFRGTILRWYSVLRILWWTRSLTHHSNSRQQAIENLQNGGCVCSIVAMLSKVKFPKILPSIVVFFLPRPRPPLNYAGGVTLWSRQVTEMDNLKFFVGNGMPNLFHISFHIPMNWSQDLSQPVPSPFSSKQVALWDLLRRYKMLASLWNLPIRTREKGNWQVKRRWVSSQAQVSFLIVRCLERDQTML